NGKKLMEFVNPISGQQVYSQHVLKCARSEEVLLFQSQFLSAADVVVWIENFGNGFGVDLFFDRAIVVADIKRFEVERLGGDGAPEPQEAGGFNSVTNYRCVVRDTFNNVVRHPFDSIV